MAERELPQADFAELTVLEAEFEDAELEIIRKAEALHAPIYRKRAEVIARIPHFWSLVFEQTPPEIDNFIQPSDSAVFADCLETFDVSRFELEDPNGSPRSFSLKFGFSDNEYFEDRVLEKKFWFRKAKDWTGIVSEPVLIHWKKGKDLTGGLTDAAYNLFEARKKLGTDTSDGKARKRETQLPEHKILAHKIEKSLESSISFFGLFAFVSGYRWVSAEESQKVTREAKEKLEKVQQGVKMEGSEDEDDDSPEEHHQEVEVFAGGDEVVTIIVEDMWPNAIKYYKSTWDEEEDDEDLSELEVSESEMMMDHEDDESDTDTKVDIRALVGKGRKSDQSPPAKKQRQE